MIDNIDISNILFLDIETVPQHPNINELDEHFRPLWLHKSKSFLKKEIDAMTEEEMSEGYQRAGIYAEFGKIICISVGIIKKTKDGEQKVYLKSYADEDEKKLLTDFCGLLSKSFSNLDRQYLCGHNIKEFDIPFICRRLLINQMELPKMLNLFGKKPWETKHLLDTMELWKFGDGKNYTSIKLLAAVFGFPSPKDDIDGSEVYRVFWEEKDLKRIAVYCEKDVLAVVQLLMRYMRKPLFEEKQVEFV